MKIKHLAPLTLSLLTIGSASALTLTQAVRHTVYTNPAVQLSEHTRMASNQGVTVARSGFLPSIDINYGAGPERSRNTNTAFGPVSLVRQDFGVNVRQILFNGFGRYNEVKRNQFKTNADSYAVWGSANEEAMLAIESYLTILQNRQLVAITRDNLRRIRGIYNLVKERSESGLGRKADMNQATSRLALARANLYAAKNELRNAITTFRKVTGLSAKNLAMPGMVSSTDVPKSMRAAIDHGVQINPKLKSAIADVAEAEYQYKASLSTNYPSLDFVIGSLRNRNTGGVRGPNVDTFALLQVSYNLFNGFGDVAKQRENAYAVDQAADIRNRTLRELIESVRFDWDSIKTSRQRIPALAVYRSASYGTVKAYKEQFKIGRRTLLDLLDSENELFNARAAYVKDRYFLRISQYRLLASMGTLLPYMNIPLPDTAKIAYKETFVMPQVNPDHGVMNSARSAYAQVTEQEADSRRHSKCASKSALPLQGDMYSNFQENGTYQNHDNTVLPQPNAKYIQANIGKMRYVAAGHIAMNNVVAKRQTTVATHKAKVGVKNHAAVAHKTKAKTAKVASNKGQDKKRVS